MTGHRDRFAAAVGDVGAPLDLPCLLMGHEVAPNLDPGQFSERLDALADVVAAGLPGSAGPAAIGRHLRATLGGDVGFGGSAADYDDLRASLLHEVLTRRRGLPILLSVVWLEIARRIDVPAHGIGLPGHFVVGLGSPEDVGTDGFVLVDPFAGGVPVPAFVVHRAIGHEPSARDMRPWDTRRTMLRILANVRNWAAGRPDRVRTRLWALELSLLIPGCPEVLRREHGEALARTGEFAAAAAQLEAYAEIVEEEQPLVAQSARQDARTARARLN